MPWIQQIKSLCHMFLLFRLKAGKQLNRILNRKKLESNYAQELE